MQLPSIIKWLLKLRSRQSILGMGVGVAFFPDKVAMAMVECSVEKPVIKMSDVFKVTNDDIWSSLSAKIEQYDLKGHQICFVLSKEQYELHLVEAPQVEISEMREAIRWRLKELISFPVNEAIYDLCPLYETPPPGYPQLLYLVVANRKKLAPLYEFVEKHRLVVQAFDIQEMALRNLLLLATGNKESVGLLQLASAEGCLTLFQQGRLFLCRQLQHGFSVLEQNSETLWEELLLEIQRSFDYYETRFMQRPIGRLFVQKEGEGAEKIVQRIQERIPAKIEVLNWSSFFEKGDPRIPWNPYLACALGAALRKRLEQ